MRKLIIVGGNGYCGRAVLKYASKLPNVKVTSVSRKEVPVSSQIPNVDYILGDSMKPDSFKDHLKDSDVVVHSIGTLIDTTITKK